jgi:hypothetical protein
VLIFKELAPCGPPSTSIPSPQVFLWQTLVTIGDLPFDERFRTAGAQWHRDRR